MRRAPAGSERFEEECYILASMMCLSNKKKKHCLISQPVLKQRLMTAGLHIERYRAGIADSPRSFLLDSLLAGLRS